VFIKLTTEETLLWWFIMVATPMNPLKNSSSYQRCTVLLGTYSTADFPAVSSSFCSGYTMGVLIYC